MEIHTEIDLPLVENGLGFEAVDLGEILVLGLGGLERERVVARRDAGAAAEGRAERNHYLGGCLRRCDPGKKKDDRLPADQKGQYRERLSGIR